MKDDVKVDVFGWDEDLEKILGSEFKVEQDDSDPDAPGMYCVYDVPVEKLRSYSQKLRHINAEYRESKTGKPLELKEIIN